MDSYTNAYEAYSRELDRNPESNPEDGYSKDVDLELGEIIKHGRDAQQALDLGVAKAEDRKELRQDVQRGNEAARKLFMRHRRYVRKEVNKRADRATSATVDKSDLIQEAEIGLFKAAQKFDPDLVGKGGRFLSYASSFVHDAIRRYSVAHERAVKTPEYLNGEILKVRKVRSELITRLGFEPSAEQIAEEANYPVALVKECLRNSQDDLALGSSGNSDEDAARAGAVLERVLSEDAEEAQERHHHRDISVIVRQRLFDVERVLEEREFDVLVSYFGIGSLDPLPVREIADMMEVGPERIRQIRNEALVKIADSGILADLQGEFIA